MFTYSAMENYSSKYGAGSDEDDYLEEVAHAKKTDKLIDQDKLYEPKSLMEKFRNAAKHTRSFEGELEKGEVREIKAKNIYVANSKIEFPYTYTIFRNNDGEYSLNYLEDKKHTKAIEISKASDLISLSNIFLDHSSRLYALKVLNHYNKPTGELENDSLFAKIKDQVIGYKDKIKEKVQGQLGLF